MNYKRLIVFIIIFLSILQNNTFANSNTDSIDDLGVSELLYNFGIINGYGGSLEKEKIFTNAQMVQLVDNSFNFNLINKEYDSKLLSVNENHWAYNAYKHLTFLNLSNILNNGDKIDNPVTLNEFSEFLYELVSKLNDNKDNFEVSYDEFCNSLRLDLKSKKGEKYLSRDQAFIVYLRFVEQVIVNDYIDIKSYRFDQNNLVSFLNSNQQLLEQRLNLQENEFKYPVYFDPDSFHNIPVGYYNQTLESIHPVNTAYYALYNYESWKNSEYKDDFFKAEFLSAAKALRENISFEYSQNGKPIGLLFYDFDWNYAGELISAPWVSGMAQGMAISVLVREYDINPDPNVKYCLEAIVNSLIKESKYYEDLTSKKSDTFWVEEYPEFNLVNGKIIESSVLNGGLLGAFGIVEYYSQSKDKEIANVINQIKNYLTSNLIKYQFDNNEPTYGLLDYTDLVNKDHTISFENAVSSIESGIPIYEVKLSAFNSSFNEDIRVMRTTGGSKNYEFEEFTKGNVFNFLLSSDGKFTDEEVLKVISVQLKDSMGNTVGETLASDNKFFGNYWSDPYFYEGQAVRDFYPGNDPYKGAKETGHFQVVLNKDISQSENMYLCISYIKLTESPVNVYMYNQGRFNLGYLLDGSSESINASKLYIPRTIDFQNYSFYYGWEPVETIDGRRAQRFIQDKDYSSWTGGWLKFKINPEDLRLIKNSDLITLTVNYFDSNDNTVFVNIFNGGNRHIAILNNTGSNQWKEEIFKVPAELFIKEGSPSPKTKIVVDTLKLMADLFGRIDLESLASTWKEKSLYYSDHRTFMLYQKTSNNNEYEIICDTEKVLLPGTTSGKWSKTDYGYLLSLKGNDFAYFSIDKNIVNNFEIKVKRHKDSSDSLELMALDKEKTTLIFIDELKNELEELKVILSKDYY